MDCDLFLNFLFWLLTPSFSAIAQVSETMAASNGFISAGYDDAEDKPMLLMKNPSDGHGLTALINRQLQGRWDEEEVEDHLDISQLIINITKPHNPFIHIDIIINYQELFLSFPCCGFFFYLLSVCNSLNVYACVYCDQKLKRNRTISYWN